MSSVLVRAAASAAGIVIASAAMAAMPASDNADNGAYGSGWTNGSNGGSGFAAWAFNDNQDGGFAGAYRAETNGDLNNIKSPQFAWGTYANQGNQPRFAAHRAFTGVNPALVNGQTFSVSMENGGIAGGGNSWVGVALRSGSGGDAPFSAGATGTPVGLFQFGFLGGEANYRIFDAGNPSGLDTGIGFTDAGLRVEFTLNNVATGAYSAKITRLSDSMMFNFNGSVGAGASITGFSLYNYNARDNDAFFNSPSVIPTPGAAALLALGGLVAVRRRR